MPLVADNTKILDCFMIHCANRAKRQRGRQLHSMRIKGAWLGRGRGYPKRERLFPKYIFLLCPLESYYITTTFCKQARRNYYIQFIAELSVY